MWFARSTPSVGWWRAIGLGDSRCPPPTLQMEQMSAPIHPDISPWPYTSSVLRIFRIFLRLIGNPAPRIPHELFLPKQYVLTHGSVFSYPPVIYPASYFPERRVVNVPIPSYRQGIIKRVGGRVWARFEPHKWNEFRNGYLLSNALSHEETHEYDL